MHIDKRFSFAIQTLRSRLKIRPKYFLLHSLNFIFKDLNQTLSSSNNKQMKAFNPWNFQSP